MACSPSQATFLKETRSHRSNKGFAFAGSAGLGVRFDPDPHLGISLQTDAYAFEEDAYYGNYNIGIVATQLGIQYIFQGRRTGAARELAPTRGFEPRTR